MVESQSSISFNSTGLLKRLSDHFLLRFGLGPRRWRELFDLGDLGRRQAGEQIFQVIEWIDPVPPATAQQGVNHRAAFPGFRMPNEQPVLFSERDWAESNFPGDFCQFPERRRPRNGSAPPTSSRHSQWPGPATLGQCAPADQLHRPVQPCQNGPALPSAHCGP